MIGASPHQAFIGYLRNEIEKARESAAFGGSMGYDGASRLEALTNSWEAGLKRLVPDELQGHLAEFERENDPEWKEYNRLKEKFE